MVTEESPRRSCRRGTPAVRSHEAAEDEAEEPASVVEDSESKLNAGVIDEVVAAGTQFPPIVDQDDDNAREESESLKSRGDGSRNRNGGRDRKRRRRGRDNSRERGRRGDQSSQGQREIQHEESTTAEKRSSKRSKRGNIPTGYAGPMLLIRTKAEEFYSQT